MPTLMYQLVLGNIRKIKMVQHCCKISQYHSTVIVTKFISILQMYSYFCTYYINIHIKCSVVRLEVIHRPNFAEVIGYKYILTFTMQVGWYA